MSGDMRTYTIGDKTFRELISEEQISLAVNREAARIARDYADLDPVYVVVLKGAMFFAADLIRAVGLPGSVEVLSAKSYGHAMESSGTVRLSQLSESLTQRHVIVVEDIVDSGLTLSTILKSIQQEQPASVSIAALLSKPSMHTVELDVRYCCFESGPAFLVGYGLDFAEHGRELRSIYELVPETV